MNTNNKEAIELIKKVYSWYGFDEFEQFNRDALAKAAKLLQDNQDTEVKEEPLLQNNPGHEHLPSGVGEGAYCVGCLEILDKPSSKVEKLNRLMVDVEQGENLREAMIRLIELIEDEE